MIRVEISAQVAEFVRTLAPEPRKAMRAALRKLEREEGDIRALEGPLKNYHRLRSGGHRIIYTYARGGKTIRCLYADRRSIVYDVFERMLQKVLLGSE